MINEESVNYVVNKLPLHIQPYARAWIAHLKDGAAMPTLKEFDVSYSEAEWARIKLAALL
jgi:hypothetical protein